MSRSISLFVTFCLLFSLSACATKKQVAPKKEIPSRVIGKVALVNQELEFVLIDSVEMPAPGTPLRVLSQEGTPTANLVVSEEQRRPFVIGNIVDGSPHAGENVVTLPQEAKEDQTE